MQTYMVMCYNYNTFNTLTARGTGVCGPEAWLLNSHVRHKHHKQVWPSWGDGFRDSVATVTAYFWSIWAVTIQNSDIIIPAAVCGLDVHVGEGQCDAIGCRWYNEKTEW